MLRNSYIQRERSTKEEKTYLRSSGLQRRNDTIGCKKRERERTRAIIWISKSSARVKLVRANLPAYIKQHEKHDYDSNHKVRRLGSLKITKRNPSCVHVSAFQDTVTARWKAVTAHAFFEVDKPGGGVVLVSNKNNNKRRAGQKEGKDHESTVCLERERETERRERDGEEDRDRDNMNEDGKAMYSCSESVSLSQ